MSVHPHVRGDNFTLVLSEVTENGSPPRAWGQRQLLQPDIIRSRFTPTCVGTTGSKDPRSSGPKVHPHVRGDNGCEHGKQTNGTVHPHVRGDNYLVARRFRAPTGSPPRAWGQHHLHECNLADNRFTPTCVGTTLEGFLFLLNSSVHPHVRGDNGLTRAWNFRDLRFTPTCVGTTTDTMRGEL